MADLPRRIFVVWFGPPMNENRIRGIQSLQSVSGTAVELITESTLPQWVVPDHPLPEAFGLLTENHRSDYLRPYLMHHHGGGYSDVKPTSGSWVPAFDALDANPSLLGAGYQEVGRHGVADFGLHLRRRWDLQPTRRDWWRYRWLQLNHRSLVGNCAFIYRPGTELTSAWLDEVERRVRSFAAALAVNPARVPKERTGHVYDGRVSEYPVPWGHLMADVHQPLVRRHRRRILKTVPTPLWDAYQ